MMDDLQFIRATVADIGEVIGMRTRFLLELFGAQSTADLNALDSALRENLSRSLADESYVCWLARTADAVVGAGGMSIRQMPGNFRNLSGRTGYLMSIYTIPSHRGRGICSEVVRRLVQTGEAMGIGHFELHATKAGEPVYRRLGFLLHDEPGYRLQSALQQVN